MPKHLRFTAARGFCGPLQQKSPARSISLSIPTTLHRGLRLPHYTNHPSSSVFTKTKTKTTNKKANTQVVVSFVKNINSSLTKMSTSMTTDMIMSQISASQHVRLDFNRCS